MVDEVDLVDEVDEVLSGMYSANHERSICITDTVDQFWGQDGTSVREQITTKNNNNNNNSAGRE